jgi:hypothetical protein
MKAKLNKVKNLINRKRSSKIDENANSVDSENVPRITNYTVAEHREEVLSSARRFIYPLQHSKHRVVIISITLFIISVIVFFAYTTIALYKVQSNSAFLYRVTQIIPFPIARSGSRFVAYENYLFELRRYTHYYETQQGLDFNSDAGQRQLREFKNRALDKVINDAYVKDLADQLDLSVPDQELDEQISIVRSQNRLGNNDAVFEDTLRDFLGWSLDDFKRSLRQQMLSNKVVAALDKETTQRAQKAYRELEKGVSFNNVAKKYSDDDSTKNDGGSFGIAIDQANRDLTAETTAALFRLKPGQYSDILNIGYALEIVQLDSKSGNKVKGSHILFTFKDIKTYVNDLKEEKPTRTYITLPASEITTPDQTSIDS